MGGEGMAWWSKSCMDGEYIKSLQFSVNIGIWNPKSIVWCSMCTEGLELCATAYARRHLQMSNCTCWLVVIHKKGCVLWVLQWWMGGCQHWMRTWMCLRVDNMIAHLQMFQGVSLICHASADETPSSTDSVAGQSSPPGRDHRQWMHAWLPNCLSSRILATDFAPSVELIDNYLGRLHKEDLWQLWLPGEPSLSFEKMRISQWLCEVWIWKWWWSHLLCDSMNCLFILQQRHFLHMQIMSDAKLCMYI